MMSSFRRDAGPGPRVFVPTSVGGGGGRGAERGFAVRRAPEPEDGPPLAEPVEPQPPERFTAEQVEALERDAFERGAASVRKANDALDRACEALEAGASGLRAASIERITAHRSLLLDLASEIATAWVGSRLEVDGALLGRVVDRAIEGAESLSPDRLRLHPADLARLLEVAEERIERWRERYGLELVEDPSLAAGELHIEARQGSIDGRHEGVRDRLREALAEALAQDTEVEQG